MTRWLSWSGGKDAALALLRLGSVEGLFVTVDEVSDLVPVHGVPRRLVEAQARALGLPLRAIPLPSPCPNVEYLGRLKEAIREVGATELAFGDIHLADIRSWRESSLEALGVRAAFPLFGEGPAMLAEQVLDLGLEALVCSVDVDRVPASLLGRAFDRSLLEALPPEVDPMGENGEFHTIVRALRLRERRTLLFEEEPLGGAADLPDGRHRVLAWA